MTNYPEGSPDKVEDHRHNLQPSYPPEEPVEARTDGIQNTFEDEPGLEAAERMLADTELTNALGRAIVTSYLSNRVAQHYAQQSRMHIEDAISRVTSPDIAMGLLDIRLDIPEALTLPKCNVSMVNPELITNLRKAKPDRKLGSLAKRHLFEQALGEDRNNLIHLLEDAGLTPLEIEVFEVRFLSEKDGGLQHSQEEAGAQLMRNRSWVNRTEKTFFAKLNDFCANLPPPADDSDESGH